MMQRQLKNQEQRENSVHSKLVNMMNGVSTDGKDIPYSSLGPISQCLLGSKNSEFPRACGTIKRGMLLRSESDDKIVRERRPF